MKKPSMTVTVKAASLKDERAQMPTAVAMFARFGKTTTTMRDRRAPRGGASNKQAAYRSDNY